MTAYLCQDAIPAIGAEPGDTIIVRPSHPHAPLAVVKRYGHQTLVELRATGELDRGTG